MEPELYGHYTLFVTYINLFSIVAVLGMDKNLIKEVAKVPNDKPRCSSLLSFSIAVSFLLFVLLSLVILFFNKAFSIPSNMIHLFLTMLLIKVIISILDGFLQGAGLVVKATFFNILLNNFLKILLFVTLINLEMNLLYTALYSFILSEIITLVFRLGIIKKVLKSQSDKGELSKSYKKQFIKYSITMSLIAGMGLLLQNVDKIMIANLLDFSSVGVYKVSQNYVALITIFIVPFVAFWPVISELYSESKITEIEREMKRIVKIVTYLAVPMFFIFLFLDEKLLLIFGKSYVSDDSQKVLILLALAFLIDAISGPIGSILTMTKYAKYVLLNNIISLALNIVLNYIFIMKFGIVGVAIGTGISIIVNNLLSIIEVKILLGIFSYDYKNIIQIIVFSFINFMIGIHLKKWLYFDNIYFYIITFTVVLYIINFLAILSIHRQEVIQTLKKGC